MNSSSHHYYYQFPLFQFTIVASAVNILEGKFEKFIFLLLHCSRVSQIMLYTEIFYIDRAWSPHHATGVFPLQKFFYGFQVFSLIFFKHHQLKHPPILCCREQLTRSSSGQMTKQYSTKRVLIYQLVACLV